jgi:hypothetical protein
VYAGTFLVAFSLLSFEITTIRTINFTVGPSHIFTAIALAMLGLSSAGSILSLFDLRSARGRRGAVCFWSCVAIGLLLVLTHFFVSRTKTGLDEALAASGRAGGLAGVVETLFTLSVPAALEIGLLLSLPYFLFGALLAYLFSNVEGPYYGRLYASDLIGAAFGCIGSILLMELTGYAVSVTAPAAFALLAAAAYARPSRPHLAAGGLALAGVLFVAPLFPGFASRVEPPADANYLVRDYGFREDVAEVWRAWNSFTRVGAVEWQDGSRSSAILSLANGDGMAWLLPFEGPNAAHEPHPPTLPALLPGTPETALVLFAGTGADLLTMKASGVGDVTGVELNGALVRGGLALEEYRLADFLGQGGVRLAVDEGRVFMERDDRMYDLILMSWSGTTAAYYAGSLGGTTQYVFTHEGISAMLDALSPDGYAVILQVNKVNMLASVRRYLEDRGVSAPERSVIVLFRPGDPERLWTRPFDNNPLLVKPAGWSDREIETIRRNARESGLELAYAPGMDPHPEFEVYQRVVGAVDAGRELALLRQETGLRFEVATDDRPFYLDLFLTSRYLDPDFWLGTAGAEEGRAHEVYHLFRVMVVLCVSLAAILLILGPLLLGRGPRATPATLSYLAYFTCLGAGFMFIEIGLMQQGSLLFGNPGLSIGLVLASIILFTGIGSLLSRWTSQRGLGLRTTAAAVCASCLLLYLALPAVLAWLLPVPLAIKALALTVLVAPGAMLMGQLFPRGLVSAQLEDPVLVPWAWGINGALSTIAAGVAPLFAQAVGLGALYVVAAGLYAALLLLPTTASAVAGRA